MPEQLRPQINPSLAIEAATDLNEEVIEAVVRGFYGRVQRDDLIGPIFAGRIDDWESHLQRMCRFWSSVALMTGSYHGQPVPAHLPLPVDGRHFDRWLDLFAVTVNELCTPAGAAHLMERARRIAQSLELAIGCSHGVVLPKGERYRNPRLDVTGDH